MIKRHFLRISASWTSERFRQIAETNETLHENEEHARDHFSKTKQTGIVPSTDMQGVLLLACGWRDVQNWKKPKTLAIQLKSSWCAEDEECNACVLRNRVKLATPQSVRTCEQSREIYRALAISTSNDTQGGLEPDS